MIKRLLKNALGKLGLEVNRTNSERGPLTMEGGLIRSKQRGLDINSVIDVGAAVGDWTKMALKHIPNAKYLLIEAQAPHKDSLEKMKKRFPNTEYVIAAAGNRKGKIYFDNSNLMGGLALEKPFDGNCIEVPVTTIDIEVKERGMKGPYLIKLDTHGFEVPILEGAKETLKSANLVIIEAYNYQLTNDSLRYFELCQYMERRGFSPIELVDCVLRKHDKSLWQMDIFFIPSKSKEFNYLKYI